MFTINNSSRERLKFRLPESHCATRIDYLWEKCSVGNGVVKRMDYRVVLKQNNPALPDNRLSDYEISGSIHPAQHISDKNRMNPITLEAS